MAIEQIGEANAAGAGLFRACGVIGICLPTLKRDGRPSWVMGLAKTAEKAAPAWWVTA
jgi:hypothetical protein